MAGNYRAAPSLFRKSNGHERDTMSRMSSAVVTVNMGGQDLGKHRSDMPGPNIIGRYTGTKVAARVQEMDCVFTLRDGSEDGFTDVSSKAIGFSNFAGLNTKGRSIDRMVHAIRFVGIAQTPSERDVEDGATGNFSCAASGGISVDNNGPDNWAIGTRVRYVYPPSDPKEKFAFDRMRTGPITGGRDTAILRAYEPTDIIFMWKESVDNLLERGQFISVPDMVARQVSGVSYGRGQTSADYLATLLKELVSACAFVGVVQACERGIVTPVTISADGTGNATLYRNATARRQLLNQSAAMAAANTDLERTIARISYEEGNFVTKTVGAADKAQLQRAYNDFYRYLAASYNLIAEEGASPENWVLTSTTQRMILGFASKKLETATLSHKIFDAAFGASPSAQFINAVRPSNQLTFASDVDTTDDHIRRTLKSSFARFMSGVGYTYNVEDSQNIMWSIGNTDSGNRAEVILGN